MIMGGIDTDATTGMIATIATATGSAITIPIGIMMATIGATIEIGIGGKGEAI
jgi:hypothetical protein